ncbi:large ribosomal subunit protein mL62 isoform X2 [Rhineura floridana]|uniref:large ribosomal subunit protein mL62 isoform X2 n=1 Tax=Rhineura floridana TaxID=261503 RepID=UPI002AC82974|nr:large ribosomal subunit protein mL62 isoform X2 [Rhineura floridana]
MAAYLLHCLWRLPVRNLLSSEALRNSPRPTIPCASTVSGCEFRSEYSLDKFYPSQQKEADITKDLENQTTPDIPVDRLSISYCRSSGPGGQNVNKVNTKAEVRFHLASADWISEDARQKMAVMHKNRITKSGELIVTSEVSRYQMRNLANCLQKIRDLIAEATETPQVQSKEDAEMIRNRVEKMNRERLRQKNIRSSIKQSRHVDFD